MKGGKNKGKASQRQATKKNKKLKEFNSKGAKKEGSEMDAFTENNVDEKDKSGTATPTSDSSSKDDLQEKLVAAKNEENIKVSAAAALSRSEPPPPISAPDNNNSPLIEKTPPPPAAAPATTPTQPQQPVLKHKYKEDQWSPLNPDGKKKYDRDFLMGLQNDPQAIRKPDNLPNIDIVQLDNRGGGGGGGGNKFNNQIGGGGYSSSMSRTGPDFAPNFFPKSSSMRGVS